MGEQAGIHFFSMELVEGVSLSDYLRSRGRMGIERSVRVIGQVSAGLEHARRAGIVHRDIKPSNILLEKGGRAKVIDLGLAKAKLEASTATRSGVVLGTPHYMAPEQSDNPSEVDTRADIYSLGITWYRALAGRPPFDGETPLQIIMQHCNSSLPALKETREDVPDAIVGVIGKMTRKRPEDRFQTPREVMVALKKFREGRPVREVVATTAERAAAQTMAEKATEREGGLLSALKRSWRLWTAAAVAGVAITVAGFLVFGGSRQERSADEQRGTPRSAAQAEAPERKPGATGGAKPPGTAGEGREGRPTSAERQAADQKASQKAFQNLKDRADSLAGEGNLKGAADALSDLPESLTDRHRQVLLQRREDIERQCSTRFDEAWTEADRLANEQQWQKAIQAVETARSYDLSGGRRADQRIQQIRTRAERARQEVEAAGKELRRLWKEQVVPHIARREYGAAADAFEKIANPESVAPADGSVSAFRAQIEALRSVQEAIENYAASLEPGAQIELAGIAGRFVSYRDGTFHFKAGDHSLKRRLSDLSLKDYLKLAGKALPEDQGTVHLAAGLLNLYVCPPDLQKARQALAAVQRTESNDPGLRAAVDHFESTLRRAEEDAAAQVKAEQLYSRAAAAFRNKDLFHCREALRRLRKQYSDSPILADKSRSPTVQQMKAATAGLGQYITVARSGQADFQELQSAIDAITEPNSMIEILDRGTYEGGIGITGESRRGLLIQAAHPRQVIIDGGGGWRCVGIQAKEVRLRGLCFANAGGGVAGNGTLSLMADCVIMPSISNAFGKGILATLPGLRRCVISGQRDLTMECDIIGCVFFEPIQARGDIVIRDSVVFGGIEEKTPSAQKTVSIHNCLVTGNVVSWGTIIHSTLLGKAYIRKRRAVADSVVRSVIVKRSAFPVGALGCDILNTEESSMGHTRSCFSAAPRFVDPANLNYFVAPGSPCRGAASDGGTIGIRPTPGLLHALQLARQYAPMFLGKNQ